MPISAQYDGDRAVRWLGDTDLDLLEQLFDRLPNTPFFVKDASLRYVAANTAMARLCGVRRSADLIGRTARDVFPASFADRYEALDARILTGGSAVRDRLEIGIGAGGARTWLLFSRFPVTDRDGSVAGIAALARRLAASDRHDPVYTRLASAVEHIRRNFEAPLDLNRLAAQANISVSQFERDFVRLFAVTPRTFLHGVRMDHAVHRLAGVDSIARIALDCGYGDHSAFTRRFRATVGISPGEYRRRLRMTQRKWAPAA